MPIAQSQRVRKTRRQNKSSKTMLSSSGPPRLLVLLPMITQRFARHLLSQEEVKSDSERTWWLLLCHINLFSTRVGEIATILYTILFIFDLFWKKRIALSTVYSADNLIFTREIAHPSVAWMLNISEQSYPRDWQRIERLSCTFFAKWRELCHGEVSRAFGAEVKLRVAVTILGPRNLKSKNKIFGSDNGTRKISDGSRASRLHALHSSLFSSLRINYALCFLCIRNGWQLSFCSYRCHCIRWPWWWWVGSGNRHSWSPGAVRKEANA